MLTYCGKVGSGDRARSVADDLGEASSGNEHVDEVALEGVGGATECVELGDAVCLGAFELSDCWL